MYYYNNNDNNDNNNDNNNSNKNNNNNRPNNNNGVFSAKLVTDGLNLLKVYSPVNRTGSPQGFLSNQTNE